MFSKVLFVFLGGWLLTGQAYSQVVQKHVLAASDSAGLFINDGASQELAFYQLGPPAGVPVQGLLLLLPGLGAQAQDVFRETSLPQEAAQAGLLTIVPTLNSRLYLDRASKQLINTAISEVLKTNSAPGRRFFIGGFSAGGHLALSYAEALLADTAQNSVVLKAVFGVDPPTDMRQFWQLGQRRMEQNCSKLLRREGQTIVASLTRAFGGSPAEFPERYRANSAFSSIDSTGGNAHWLTSIPVRLYAEPDIAYWQQHYCKTFTADDLTARTSARLIERLQKLGNSQAQYMETNGKGFIGARRFPHSWSILDAKDCVSWMQGIT